MEVRSGHVQDDPSAGRQPVQPTSILRELTVLGMPQAVVLDGDPVRWERKVDARHEHTVGIPHDELGNRVESGQREKDPEPGLLG
jgi:hypothetical protein